MFRSALLAAAVAGLLACSGGGDGLDCSDPLVLLDHPSDGFRIELADGTVGPVVHDPAVDGPLDTADFERIQALCR